MQLNFLHCENVFLEPRLFSFSLLSSFFCFPFSFSVGVNDALLSVIEPVIATSLYRPFLSGPSLNVAVDISDHTSCTQDWRNGSAF